jgi:predicted 2-oxoglutarate/Fe(II)-dependent dioxygenase YbiX
VLRLFVDTSPVEVQPAAGLLVAFPADALHEVTVVQGGVRDVVVDWFYGGP